MPNSGTAILQIFNIWSVMLCILTAFISIKHRDWDYQTVGEAIWADHMCIVTWHYTMLTGPKCEVRNGAWSAKLQCTKFFQTITIIEWKECVNIGFIRNVIAVMNGSLPPAPDQICSLSKVMFQRYLFRASSQWNQLACSFALCVMNFFTSNIIKELWSKSMSLRFFTQSNRCIDVLCCPLNQLGGFG